MSVVAQKLVVVGGNGFIGSAICKAALGRGMQVTSISSSGKPYQTPKGHCPVWTSQVDWQKGDALDPHSYAHILPGSSAVVHTLGTLFENGVYKDAIRNGNLVGLLQSFVGGINGGNPLEQREGARRETYEIVNRDAALRVCETYLSTPRSPGTTSPRAFVYISAEDISRPFVPVRYIETKREAERAIEHMLLDRPGFRAVYIRPSLVYHPHYRPLTSPIAAMLDLSATLHSKAPHGFPTPSNILRSFASTFGRSSTPPHISLINPSPLESVANALVIPPIHVEHVAEAVCAAVDSERADVRGVVGVKEMRDLIGWSLKGSVTGSPV